jgi:hypothetical protein
LLAPQWGLIAASPNQDRSLARCRAANWNPGGLVEAYSRNYQNFTATPAEPGVFQLIRQVIRSGNNVRKDEESKTKGRSEPEHIQGTEPKVSVVIPVYNEMATIEEILLRIKDVRLDKEIITVDDGSKDGTRNFLIALAESAKSAPAQMKLPKRGRVLSTDRIRVFFQDRNWGNRAAKTRMRRGS